MIRNNESLFRKNLGNFPLWKIHPLVGENWTYFPIWKNVLMTFCWFKKAAKTTISGCFFGGVNMLYLRGYIPVFG